MISYKPLKALSFLSWGSVGFIMVMEGIRIEIGDHRLGGTIGTVEDVDGENSDRRDKCGQVVRNSSGWGVCLQEIETGLVSR